MFFKKRLKLNKIESVDGPLLKKQLKLKLLRKKVSFLSFSEICLHRVPKFLQLIYAANRYLN